VLLQIGGKWNLRHCLQCIPPLPLFTSTDASLLAAGARVGRWYRTANVARAERVAGGRAHLYEGCQRDLAGTHPVGVTE